MAEGRGNPPDEYLKIPPQETHSRRGFLRLSRNVALATGAAVLGRGMHPPERAGEYLFDKGPVKFILGSHLISPDINEIYAKFPETGDLGLCIWKPKTVALIDREMQAAKREGKPFFLMLDSLSATSEKSMEVFQSSEIIGGQNGLSMWPSLPHPDLSRKEAYPEKIYVISADQTTDYGLVDVSYGMDADRQLVINALNNRYRQPTREELIKEAKEEIQKVLPDKIAEGALAATLLGAGLNLTSETTRRKVFKILSLFGGAAAAEAVKGGLQGNLASAIIGKLSDPEEQKIATILSNSTEWTIGDQSNRLWVNARTALAVEKARDLSQTLPSATSQNPSKINLLYGPAHSAHLPRIMEDQSYRHDLIADYLKDMLQFADIEIKKNDRLIPHRDELLRAIALSITPYRVDEIKMPWGKKTIPPEKLQDFTKALVEKKTSGNNQALIDLAMRTLKEFGIEE